MQLNHINLTVPDVPASAAFLSKYFDMRESAGGNKGFTVLFDEQGLVLTLMKGRSDAVRYPDTFHIGFGQPNEAAVNQLNQRLKNDGYDIQPPEHSHAYTFYVQAPGGFTVEVMS